MTLQYVCDICGTIVIIHHGEMSRIPFGKMPQKILDASNHKCTKRKMETK